MAQNARDLQNRELRDTIKVLNSTIEDLRKLLKESNEQNEALRQQVEYLTKKLFGTSSEKRSHESEGQISLSMKWNRKPIRKYRSLNAKMFLKMHHERESQDPRKRE